MGVIRGEPVVLAGTEPKALLAESIVPGSVRVRSTFGRSDRDTVEYREREDYVVDCRSGTIVRTPRSRIPDYSRHPRYGAGTLVLDERTPIEKLRNTPFLAYVDYDTAVGDVVPDTPPAGARLSGLRPRPAVAEGSGTVVFLGDSIVAGHDASSPERSYRRRVARWLQRRRPAVRCRVYNRAVGGSNSSWGVEQMEKKVLPLQPDILVIGFGMNDQNRRDDGETATPLSLFESNVRAMVRMAQERGPCTVVLVSPIYPNPRWNRYSGRTDEFRDALSRIAGRPDCVLADMTPVWKQLLRRKTPEDLLANNLNHPEDFGHRVHAQVLAETLTSA
jgi:lysophospholipase L1-like esterase